MATAERDHVKAPPWQRRQAAWDANASAWPTRSGRRRAARASLLAGLIAGALIGGYVAGVSDDRERLNPFASDPLLVWSNESFDSKREFLGWLAERGLSYREWSKRHPQAAAKLDAHALLASAP